MKLSKEKLMLQMARCGFGIPELAKAYGVKRQRMYDIFRAEKVTPKCLKRLADALGCEVTDLIDYPIA